MRSRFSAFVRGYGDYLLKTWYPDTRPAAEKPGGMGLDWLHLRIEETEAGGIRDEHGVVAFTATFRDGRKVRRLHERSRFVRESGQWFYVDGECRIEEQGRNAPCFCGSGKKFKHCCLTVQQHAYQQEASS